METPCLMILLLFLPITTMGLLEILGPPTEFLTSTHPAAFKLAVRRWSPSQEPKATVVLQHGGGWHSGYYDELGNALKNSGYEVVALDAMGHGYSEGPLRDDKFNAAVTAEQGVVQSGITYWTTLSDVQADLSKLCAQEKAARNVPLVVVGESMGALVAGPIVMEEDPNVDAIVTAGGLMRMTKETQPPPIACFIFEVLGRFFPKKNIILEDLDATFDTAFGKPEWASTARADSLISTNSFYMGPASENFKGMKKLRTKAFKIKIPLLVMHSKVDTRTDYAAAVSFFEDAGSADKTLTSYEDASHLLFLDTDANTKRAIGDLTAWLDERFVPKALDEGPEVMDEGPEVMDDVTTMTPDL